MPFRSTAGGPVPPMDHTCGRASAQWEVTYYLEPRGGEVEAPAEGQIL
jgi:hypothetical protein